MWARDLQHKPWGRAVQGGAGCSQRWGSEQSQCRATWMGLIRLAVFSGPCAVPCQTFQENRSSPKKAAFWIKSYIGGTQTEPRAESCFDVHKGRPAARVSLHFQEWGAWISLVIRKSVHLLLPQYVTPSNWKRRSLSPFTLQFASGGSSQVLFMWLGIS